MSPITAFRERFLVTRYLLFLLLLAVLLPTLGTAEAADQKPDTSTVDTATGTDTADQMVDIGGYKLHARVFGAGRPAVVFDTGLGDTLETWKQLPTTLAATTQVVTYTRAGHGRSDPGPLPRTGQRRAEELQALLGQLAIEPPFLLVGHSLAGINLRIFAELYPDQVAGLVLLDPTTEEMKPRLVSEQDRQSFAAQLALLPDGARAEQEQLAEDVAALSRLGPPPDCPAVVITSMADPVIPEALREQAELTGMTVERLRELQQRGWTFHETLASRFSQHRHIAAKESQHYIQHDQPVLVLQEILWLLNEIRSADTAADAADPGSPAAARSRVAGAR